MNPAQNLVSSLQGVAAAAGGLRELHEEGHSELTLWRSTQRIGQRTHYRASLPAGLHLGCGLAHLRSRLDGGGFVQFDGAGASLLVVPRGQDTQVHTELEGNQAARACGALLTGSSKALVSPGLQEWIESMDEPRLLGSTAVPLSEIVGLCLPIDPFFQGAARALAQQARALQLAALVAATLGKSETFTRPIRHRRVVERARDLLEARLVSPPELAELAREVGLNPRSLTQAFKACTGMSIGAYVTGRRLQRALDLLERGASVLHAAASVGYSPAHFSTAFKRAYGLSPRAVPRAKR